MKKFWKVLLQKKKIQVSIIIVAILWGLAVMDKFGNVFAWETFLPGISGKIEDNEEEVKVLFGKCQGEGVTEYYEGTGSVLDKEDLFTKNITVWIENNLRESFPKESWEIKEYPKEEAGNKKELQIENKSQTITGMMRIFIDHEKTRKSYIHFVFYSKGREDTLYPIKDVWNKKMKENEVTDYKDYYYRTFCFDGKLTKGEQKQAARQYLQYFGVEKIKESEIEGMENVYGYTKKIENSTIVENKKINFHVALAYEEQENKTRLYLATPFLNTDY